MGQESRRPAGARRSAACVLRPHERSMHASCGGTALNVDVAHLRPVVEVMVRHFRVARRRRDHNEPERRAGGMRVRPAVDVTRHGEPGGDVVLRRVDLDGGQVVDGDSLDGCRIESLSGPARNLTSAGRARRRPQEH